MKRDYIAPSVDAVVCEYEGVIAASSEQLQDGGSIPVSSSQSRGSWGNIWNNNAN